MCLPSEIVDCVEKVHCDLYIVFKWVLTNGLCLNPKKSNVLIMDKVGFILQLPPIQIDNIVIELVYSVKYLGVISDNSLNWSNDANANGNRLVNTVLPS